MVEGQVTDLADTPAGCRCRVAVSNFVHYCIKMFFDLMCTKVILFHLRHLRIRSSERSKRNQPYRYWAAKHARTQAANQQFHPNPRNVRKERCGTSLHLCVLSTVKCLN
jgi:hypothetical protein